MELEKLARQLGAAIQQDKVYLDVYTDYGKQKYAEI